MKTKTIILFLIIQSAVFSILSQNMKEGFDITVKKNVTWFDDINFKNYKGFPPKSINGKEIGDPSSNFSTFDKYKKIESDIFSEEERKSLRTKYTPVVLFIVNAKDGKILAVTFTFRSLPDSSLIDTEKLSEFRRRVMSEISYNNLLFGGEKAASGYMLAGFPMFKPRK